MATATATSKLTINAAKLQTALQHSFRPLRRRRLGHIGPNHYSNELDKWGRKKSHGAAPSLAAGGRRIPAPRASLILGHGGNGSNDGSGYGGSVQRRNGDGATLTNFNGSAAASSSNGKTLLNGSRHGSANGTNGKSDYHHRIALRDKNLINGPTFLNGQINNINNNNNDHDDATSPNEERSHQKSDYPSSGYASDLVNGTNGKSDYHHRIALRDKNLINGPTFLNGQIHNIDIDHDDATSPNEEATHRKSDYPSSGYASDLVVVLDMDECLIHSQFLSDQIHDKYRQAEERPAGHAPFQHAEEAEAIIATTCENFKISLPDGDLVHVNKRPNLDLFLREITAKFETYIFTAAMEVYAAPVLNRLDPAGTMFKGIFYRDSCVYDADLNVYSKDLCQVLQQRKKMLINASSSDSHDEYDNREQLLRDDKHSDFDRWNCDERRVVLVDNNPLSFLPNPSNGILVSSFYDDPKDDTLEAVMELLNELDETEDVRPVLEERFGLKDALKDVMKESLGW
eukprot:CAMPEP_0171446940 /NCGR_PEP_ID=MMETSP0881-20121228/38850_1 /TAXON_ID=67004 /ORGANISM="Thalassiosira weissflogii, Strain CCMP1336" /LENGTH=513 /DNA_ID=CAMNT_0011971339 /DNA_START=287 /DNA_END=1825 /DNA_ORIENTATION=-